MSDTHIDVDDNALSAEVSKLDTIPEAPDEYGTRQRVLRTPGGSALSVLRWAWYSLTSMRTALILLFLLALASVPGSILPQRGGSDPLRVSDYYAKHPTLAPILDRLGLFNVFGSVWFAAIYLLLFISLAGCVLPRSRRHFKAMRQRPPAAPRNISRLPVSTSWHTDESPDVALARAHELLRSKHFRVDRADNVESRADRTTSSVNAEKGHLRETGNLLFHLSLLVVLVGIAMTSVFGFTGSVLVKEHDGFTDTTIDYDSFSPGRFVNIDKLPPFSFTLNKFEATYQRGGPANGDADTFAAQVSWQPNLSAQPRDYTIEVNHPLSTQGTNVYLGGHGYAPHFIVRDGSGNTFDETVPFLPQPGTSQYNGVVKLPDAKPSQLGVTGFFLPTASKNPVTGMPTSIFPAPDNPAVVIGVFSGDLGLNNGIPQSVYSLDTSKMTRLATTTLRPGDTLTLPNGAGSVTFVGYDQWAAFNITHDPGKPVVFGAVCATVLGLVLSLAIRRRRLWVRAGRDESGRTLVEVGGLTRTDASGGFDDEFQRVVTALQAAAPPTGQESASARQA
ncbi:MAG TPA: cytochrome c biogenesis protein ResB [Acidothermaceae bacterium]|nr:cytochrome c biogenesis protein ResB [Acidothermaceae bacterium]